MTEDGSTAEPSDKNPMILRFPAYPGVLKGFVPNLHFEVRFYFSFGHIAFKHGWAHNQHAPPCFPTCQVRVSRFQQSCFLLLLTASARFEWARPGLKLQLQMPTRMPEDISDKMSAAGVSGATRRK